MNLLNYTLKYLSITLLAVIGIWAAIFYFNMIDEVRDSLDDGLENNKMVVIQKVEKDSSTISRAGFSEHNYAIREIEEALGLGFKDRYKDTMMYTLNEQDLEPFRMLTTAFTDNHRYYELKLVASTIEEGDLLADLLYSLMWLYAFILISILVINNVLLRKIWTPFYLLLTNLKTFRLNKDQYIKTARTNVKEFKELNETVNKLVEQSVDTYRNQKQFIENAAHELQTPLAISLNRLELLAENEDLSDSHLESIGQVIRTLQRLTRLNKSLLLISKIENRQYGSDENLSINAMVKTLLSEFEDFAETKEVSIYVEESETIKAFMNKDLATILISNLLKNAISYTTKGGTVKLVLASSTLMISNTGVLSPLNAEKIFKRFQKGDNEKSSNGLGLAIVKAISDIYGYELYYSYHQQHEFTVHFH